MADRTLTYLENQFIYFFLIFLVLLNSISCREWD